MVMCPRLRRMVGCARIGVGPRFELDSRDRGEQRSWRERDGLVDEPVRR